LDPAELEDLYLRFDFVSVDNTPPTDLLGKVKVLLDNGSGPITAP
jgi:hypothetical protein